MANVFENFFSQAMTGDTIKDWDHASRLYVANNYNLAPKHSFLFHVFFEFNPVAKKLNGMQDAQGKQKELGMLVKSVQLPKYNADMSTLNAYNRPHVIQKKMHHSPVQITFHDDSANVVRNFWYDYYSYYYRNTDYSTSSDLAPYNGVHKEITNARKFKDWGYSVRGSTDGTNVTAPYLNSIRIFSLHNKQFSEYVLVNPIIKDFSHGQHNASEGGSTMEHSMSVEYETVLYAFGRVSPANVDGFADLHYDKRPSPLSAAGGGTQSLIGPGGLSESIGEISQDLENGNFAAAAFKAGRVTNGLKGANLGAMAAVAAGALGSDLLGVLGGTGATNPFGSVSIPGIGGLMTALGGVASGVSKANSVGTMVKSPEGLLSAASSAGPLSNTLGSVRTLAEGTGTSLAGSANAALVYGKGEVRTILAKLTPDNNVQGSVGYDTGDMEA